MISDLKTVRIPCCCRLRRRVLEIPLMYGSTVVDLNTTIGHTVTVSVRASVCKSFHIHSYMKTSPRNFPNIFLYEFGIAFYRVVYS